MENQEEYRLLSEFILPIALPNTIKRLIKGDDFTLMNQTFKLKSEDIIADFNNPVYSVYFRPDFKIAKGSNHDIYLPLMSIKKK